MKYQLCFAFSLLFMAFLSSCVGPEGFDSESTTLCAYCMESISDFNSVNLPLLENSPDEQMRARLVGTWQEAVWVEDGREVICEKTFYKTEDRGTSTCLGEGFLSASFAYQLNAASSELRTFAVTSWRGDIGMNRFVTVARYHLDWIDDDEIHVTLLEEVLRNYEGGEPEHFGYEIHGASRNVWKRKITNME